MKKLILLLVCISLICPVAVLAKKNNNSQSSEMYPRVVDANGKTVGYPIDVNGFVMPYNGKQYRLKPSSETIRASKTFYIEPSCAGETYAFSGYHINSYGLVDTYGIEDNLYEVSSNCFEANVSSHLNADGTCQDYPEPGLMELCELEYVFYIPAEMQFPLRIVSSLPEN